MANTNLKWEEIYIDYQKSGLSRGDFIRKHQLSNYAFEKFKKLKQNPKRNRFLFR